MKIVITGASGFVAEQIIPSLLKNGIDLLLVGRDPAALSARYPALETCGYDQLADSAKGASAVLHLAVRNNDQEGDLAAFRETNVNLLRQVIDSAKSAGINRLIFTSTLQVEDSRSATPYGQSKAEAEALIAEETGMTVSVLRLAAVYGTDFKGKLAMVKKLPGLLRPLAFGALASLRPTVHADHVGTAVMAAARGELDGTHLITDEQRSNGFYLWVKRIIDLLFAVFVIVVLWWVLLIAWIAVKVSSPGPGIFSQERVGKNAKTFTCYKFRTMHSGTKQAGTHEVTAAAVTKAGAFMRKTKIDELPQVLNILKNEVSLIGPRPCLPNQLELIEERRARGVFSVKPGISGWAQIQNIDMSEPERLARVDQEYIALQTLLMDLKIIIKTITGSGQGDKVSN